MHKRRSFRACVSNSSRQYKSESIKYAEFDGAENNHSYCYLIAADLSRVIAKPAFFPFAGQWNAFNPFRELSEIYDINALDKLQRIIVAD